MEKLRTLGSVLTSAYSFFGIGSVAISIGPIDIRCRLTENSFVMDALILLLRVGVLHRGVDGPAKALWVLQLNMSMRFVNFRQRKNLLRHCLSGEWQVDVEVENKAVRWRALAAWNCRGLHVLLWDNVASISRTGAIIPVSSTVRVVCIQCHLTVMSSL